MKDGKLEVAIVCDNWKLPIFKQILTDAGYEYTHLPFTKDSTSIFVLTSDAGALAYVIQDCQNKAAELKN